MTPPPDSAGPRPHRLHVTLVDDTTVRVSGAATGDIVDVLRAGAEVVVVDDATGGAPDPMVSGLLAREATIVELVASGLSNQAIAQRLFLSVNTVKSYIRSAYRKMGVESRSQAVLWAVEHRMVRPGRHDEAENPGA